MYLEIEKSCDKCKKEGIVRKCAVCIVTFKKMELFLKKKQEIMNESKLSLGK